MTEEEKQSVFGKLSKEEAQKQLLMNTILSDITITTENLNDQMDRS